jgi:RNA polymerase sigma-32 factor
MLSPYTSSTTPPTHRLDTDTAPAPCDSLHWYAAEIRRYPLLSREEEYVLAVRYKEDGDMQAAYRLVTANLRLVMRLARQYQRTFHPLPDLIQEGNLGLVAAVRKFDPSQGVRFPSYAVWWVRAYIIRYLVTNWRMVKLGTTNAQRKLFFNLNREKGRLQAMGISPTPRLLSQHFGMDEEAVMEMEQRMAVHDLSIDAQIADREGANATFLDFFVDQSATAEEEVIATEDQHVISKKMAAFVGTLKGRERVIFTKRLVAEEPLALRAIGDQYGISRERVRQLECRLKAKLKAYLLQECKDGRTFPLEDSPNIRRSCAARPPLPERSGGLLPYKLRRTTAYIQAHLAQELSLAQLASVAQTNPAHFARLFKHATGLAPHQYVIACRMEQAKRLLAETDLPLSEIALQVGCTDQSHFSALFRVHVALTPTAYRDKTRS